MGTIRNATDERSVIKVFTVKHKGHTYYAQEMQGHYGLGRDFAVMKDRERIYYGRFKTETEAIAWLLEYLKRELIHQTKLVL